MTMINIMLTNVLYIKKEIKIYLCFIIWVCSLVTRPKGRTLRVSGNRLLRGIFGTKWGEVTRLEVIV
jgi:hypothetical protein